MEQATIHVHRAERIRHWFQTDQEDSEEKRLVQNRIEVPDSDEDWVDPIDRRHP